MIKGIVINGEPTMTRIQLIGILIALEAFFLPLYACLQGGNFPTALEVSTWIVFAVIQEITYWMVFLKKNGDDKEPS